MPDSGTLLVRILAMAKVAAVTLPVISCVAATSIKGT